MAEKVEHTAGWRGNAFIRGWSEPANLRKCKGIIESGVLPFEDAEPAQVPDHLAAAKFLGERLRELRRRHGLTQEQAAALCGMEYKYYQMVEWGRKNLRLDTMARLAGAYHLEVWDLVQRQGIPASRVKRVREVVSAPRRPPRPRGRPRKLKS